MGIIIANQVVECHDTAEINPDIGTVIRQVFINQFPAFPKTGKGGKADDKSR